MTEELSINSNSLNTSPSHNANVIQSDKNLSESDDDNEFRFSSAKSKLNRVAESDSDTDKENDLKIVNNVFTPNKSDSDDSNVGKIIPNKKKSRIRNISNSDNESLSENENVKATNNYDLTRTKNRHKGLQDKFKKLKNSKSGSKENTDKPSTETSDVDSDNSLNGAISCTKIKQKIKKKASHTLTLICDPDTSEEETNDNGRLQKSSKHQKPRSTKLISPKAVRMSAKQAMENMQKIKSESNRMLREKEVSLPYHRPKALTLKDIMDRRKPALTSDGKTLPIKMNNEQLKQYALMLEQRQKEMMELCKSDTDEEEENHPEDKHPTSNSKDNNENSSPETALNQDASGPCDTNDKIYDYINMINNMNDDSTGYNLNEQNIKEVDSEKIQKNFGGSPDNNHNGYEKTENETRSAARVQTGIDSQTKEISILYEHVAPLPFNELNNVTEQESQKISLHYDSEKTEVTDLQENIYNSEQKQTVHFQDNAELRTSDKTENDNLKTATITDDELKNKLNDEFSDNDFTMEELEEIIANAEINKDTSSKALANIEATLEIKPTLTGTPGMIIDLDNSDENTQRKLTGVELLKERFKYFARLKSLEDMEKDREKKFKPGVQHLKLKQELEEQIAEQRSLEWEKRLQAENQFKAEMNIVESEGFDGEDIEKIEAKLEENNVVDEEEESSSDEDIEDTDDYVMKDKPRIRNPLIDDEAEVSEDEDVNKVGDVDCKEHDPDDNDSEIDNQDVNDENDSEDDEEENSSQSEEEAEKKTNIRKGRILKAFEDSDDEDSKTESALCNALQMDNHTLHQSQDDEIQLAQPLKTFSDDLFTSQECTQKSSNETDEAKIANTSLEDLGSQTFSILKSGIEITDDKRDVSFEKIDVIYETQPCSDDNFHAIVGMCTGGFSQNLVTPQAESSQLSPSQEIGDDVAELCTGKFYDNPFVSQAVGEVENKIEDESMAEANIESQAEKMNTSEAPDVSVPTKVHEGENKLLKSILDELNDPEFDSPKPNKYFFNAIKNQDKTAEGIENTQFKKKFVIESDDDETNEGAKVTDKKTKRKKRKMENRALQISDDEEDEYSESEQEACESDIEDDNEKLVEYDSEENEIEIQTKLPKKKRRGTDFFEQEAELTSEDEWIGSGDEDEAGLDRMEREEGDDDTFHQGKLQRELGEIHMREVLDQDKREVRLLQELLFEDGDLGDGHRQRKFRWKNADGEEETGTNADEYADTQEDEFESEEQWRKQRHERETFLRKLQEQDEEDGNVSINRSAFIKAGLTSKPSSMDSENIHNPENGSSLGNSKINESIEKKTANSVPSPKKPFILLQQNYHNSLLTRGRGALARLAALATPLAGDGDDAPKVNASSNRGNFVFAAITPETGSKVTKRKADIAPDTPRLLKKMKQDCNRSTKNSLLDHL